jgi:hypothetical protein
LLPYETNEKSGERFADGLNEFLLLLVLARESIEVFHRGELFHFDPLVGENACQIRAVKIALVLRDPRIFAENLFRSIESSIRKIEFILSSGRIITDPDISLADFLEQHNLDISLCGDQLFLIKSFILTKTKVVRPFFKPERPLVENAYTDSKKIKDIMKVGSSFSGELVKKLRKKLSARSASFVQELAEELEHEEAEVRPLLEEFSSFHNGLHCLPYYWATRVLMIQALKNEIPIAMLARQLARDQDYKVVENITIFYKATPEGYEEVSADEFHPETPVMVLIGSTCRDAIELPSRDIWKKELIAQCPTDLVLAYAAAHRQYPDESKAEILQGLKDQNYEYHKMKAQEWGCSLDNPYRFFLTHAFCDKIKNIHRHI